MNRKRDFGLHILDEEKDTQISFRLYPEKVRRRYGVQLKFEDEHQKAQHIHFEMDVVFLEQIDEDTFVVELHKHQIYLDNKAPNLVMDQFAEQCGAVLYPMQLYVNRNLSVLGIANHQEMVNRWLDQKIILQKNYSGKQTDAILQAMDDTITDPLLLITEIKEQDWFFSLFFTKISIYAVQGDQNIGYPLVPYLTPIHFTTKDYIEYHPKRQEDILITRSGAYTDPRTETDITQGRKHPTDPKGKKPDGTVALKYHLYKDAPIWDAILGGCTIKFPSGAFKIVDVEIYHLKDKTPKTVSEQQVEIQEVKHQEPEPKKKKKRYFFFGKELKL